MLRSAVYSHTDAMLLLPLLLPFLLPQVNTATRDAMVHALRQAGVQTGGCGAFSIRLRPSMVFGQEVRAIYTYLSTLHKLCIIFHIQCSYPYSVGGA